MAHSRARRGRRCAAVARAGNKMVLEKLASVGRKARTLPQSATPTAFSSIASATASSPRDRASIYSGYLEFNYPAARDRPSAWLEKATCDIAASASCGPIATIRHFEAHRTEGQQATHLQWDTTECECVRAYGCGKLGERV
jgi:hypothetical protein